MEQALTTPRLVIRHFDESHLNNPRYISWLSDRDTLVALNLVDYILNPVSLERLATYYAAFKRSDTNHLLAITTADGGEFIGTAALREIGYRGLYDLGILIGDRLARGKGYARETIGAVARYAFGTLNARKLTSSFSDTNHAVMMAFLKNGFKLEGYQREQQCGVDGALSGRYIVGLLPADLETGSRLT